MTQLSHATLQQTTRTVDISKDLLQELEEISRIVPAYGMLSIDFHIYKGSVSKVVWRREESKKLA